jgi:hypothetical protein
MIERICAQAARFLRDHGATDAIMDDGMQRLIATQAEETPDMPAYMVGLQALGNRLLECIGTRTPEGLHHAHTLTLFLNLVYRDEYDRPGYDDRHLRRRYPVSVATN